MANTEDEESPMEVSEDISLPASETSFIVRGGETYFERSGKTSGEMMLFGDFTLKILGEIKGDQTETEGYWVMQCSMAGAGDQLEKRTIALRAGAFDSKKDLVDILRKKFGWANFYVNGRIQPKDLYDYIMYLKRDYQANSPQRIYHDAPYIGFYQPNYWVLSQEDQVEGLNILPDADKMYYILDERREKCLYQ